MGNKTKAIQEYADGWRAITHEGNPYTAKLGELPLRVTDFDHMDLWEYLLEIHNRSISWKERHAKGVPVKMSYSEWKDWLLIMPMPNNIKYILSDDEGIPRIVQKRAATFCNFRYKPEWMEKKGGANV